MQTRTITTLVHQIAADRKDARIKHGTTNGQPVVHVQADRRSYTLRSLGDWLDCPLHPQSVSASREVELDHIAGLMANEDAR